MKTLNKAFKKLEILSFSMLFIFVLLSSLYAARLGAVNSSGTIDIVDAIMTARHYAGLIPPGFTVSAVDVSGDGPVNIVDALIIAQYQVGLIDRFPASSATSAPGRMQQPTLSISVGQRIMVIWCLNCRFTRIIRETAPGTTV